MSIDRTTGIDVDCLAGDCTHDHEAEVASPAALDVLLPYELWNTRSRSAIGSYDTQDAALDAVRNLLGRGYSASSLFLGRVDSAGNSKPVASGDQLAEAATTKAVDDALREASPAALSDEWCNCDDPAGWHNHDTEPPKAAPPAALDVERLRDILDEAEGDGIIGPDYTPMLLAEYILARLSPSEGSGE